MRKLGEYLRHSYYLKKAIKIRESRFYRNNKFINFKVPLALSL